MDHRSQAHKAPLQLEQTGSTIFQTLAGMALDIKTKKPAAESIASIASSVSANGDVKDMQYLLNAFLLLNVFQFGAIIALAHLDRKQKHAEARRTSALLPPIIEEDDEPFLDASSPKEPAEEDEWHQQDQSSPAVHSKSLPGTIRSLRGIPAPPAGTTLAVDSSIPLRRSASQSSSMRSRYLIPGTPTSGQVVRTKREVKRGEIFALLCGGLIAFAWLLFMGTAWLRLRSKEERGASIHH